MRERHTRLGSNAAALGVILAGALAAAPADPRRRREKARPAKRRVKGNKYLGIFPAFDPARVRVDRAKLERDRINGERGQKKRQHVVTHAMLTAIGVPRTKDGNRLGLRKRCGMGIA